MIKPKTVFLGALGLVWWLTKPARKDDAMRAWQGNFSHRGLHDQAAPENTRAAFEKSLARGIGYEFDVQLTKDDQLVIHHDFDGRRSMNEDLRLAELSLAELQQRKLFGTDQTIMTLAELLELTAGRVRLILEIKTEKNSAHISRLVARELDNYSGEVVIESFHPGVLGWFRRHRPDMIRGQLSYNSFRHTARTPLNFLLTNYLFNWWGRPHFVAHDFAGRRDWGFLLQHWLHRTPLVVYTIKSPADHAMAREIFPTIIFENYLPPELAD